MSTFNNVSMETSTVDVIHSMVPLFNDCCSYKRHWVLEELGYLDQKYQYHNAKILYYHLKSLSEWRWNKDLMFRYCSVQSERSNWWRLQIRALCGTVFFIPLLPAPTEFLTITACTRNTCVTLPPAPAMCMSTPACTCKTLRIYARTITELHWLILCVQTLDISLYWYCGGFSATSLRRH